MVRKATLIFASMVASLVLPQSLVLAKDNQEPKAPAMPGGWTNTRSPTPDDLAVWQKVITNVNTDLASMGQPVEVSSQVVSGIKYKFIFSNGDRVGVYSVPWLQKLEVSEVKKDDQ
mmetsp:Transcript_37972/g.47063  ORF Transcript_37972/g.47063 Transcript_37972/m.47063 type:complete len:116 (+) Transcript_37972:57-404(+)|eukprot:CAMPEP_0114662018 /NCGR_PEP_ID=MMETSP0191-20121206/23904_1 /TAXON_ID=126664 /ORGANISM="Sorites sp." /LENGTH=115 /DNA_ID=CAMNT_0001896773 /DNA_START=47 /DNA_END=394 /DNA_ORIENTATION=+